MNKKGFVNMTLVILVVFLIGIIGYLTLVRKPLSTTNNPIITSSKPVLEDVDWESLISDIRIELKQAFPDMRVEEFRPVNILKKVDITGDGVPEALVDLGGGGGATISLVVLMKIENNKPVVTRFKQKDGNISSLLFGIGGGGGGRYGNAVEMIGSENAIYSASYSKYGKSSDSCNAEAYQWNSQAKIFELNAELSNEVQQDYCRNVKIPLP